jgi:hypothetical protein
MDDLHTAMVCAQSQNRLPAGSVLLAPLAMM